MRKLKRLVYQTVEEIEDRIRLRERDAERMPPGEGRQSILREIAQLRSYALVKRWVSTGACTGKAASS
jgi:hypothetical protein